MSYQTGAFPMGGGGGFGGGIYAAALLGRLLGGGTSGGGGGGGFAAWQQRRMAEHAHKLGQEAADAELRRHQAMESHKGEESRKTTTHGRTEAQAMMDYLSSQGHTATSIHTDGPQWRVGGLTMGAAPAGDSSDAGSSGTDKAGSSSTSEPSAPSGPVPPIPFKAAEPGDWRNK